MQTFIHANRKSIYYLRRGILPIFLFLLSIITSSIVIAQSSPADCKTGCTSNDVQIQAAYLSDAAGNQLSSSFVCPGSGKAIVSLTLELTTKTPRVGVVIHLNVKNFNPLPLPNGTIGSLITTFAECFGEPLNQATNKVTFNQTFEWTCGNPIVITDVFIGWGTGNSNFCTGTGFQCPATSSKCYSLPPGQYIPIVTPNANTASKTLCSTAPGGTTATFNLTALESEVKGSQVNVNVSWFTDEGLTNSIATPGAYVSASGDVYAKVTSTISPFPFSKSKVTLTVNKTPNLSITNPAAVCSPNTVSLLAAAVTAGSDLPSGTTLSYGMNSDGTGSIATPASVGNGTYYIKATTNTTPACSDIKAVTVTVNSAPAAPTVCIVEPSLCGPTTGSVTITSPIGAGYQYSIDNGTTWSTNTSFNNLAPGSVTGIKAKKDGCISAAADCSNSSCSSAVTINQQSSISETVIPIDLGTTGTNIKAFPNPYNDRIRFVINSTETGMGSLEVHNMLGQKVKTVYQGKFTPGTQSFELQVPNSQRSTLIYVLKLNGKQVSGKMLQSPE